VAAGRARHLVTPALKLGILAYVRLGVRLPHSLPRLPLVFGKLERPRQWSMIEIYLLPTEAPLLCEGPGWHRLLMPMVSIDWSLSPEPAAPRSSFASAAAALHEAPTMIVR
jgi:hypothetical protein